MPTPPEHPINLLQVPNQSLIRESELRNADINSGSIIDIHYPASKVGALLVHTNDVVAPNKAIALLQKENLQPIKDFNPLDPVHLVDPSYKDSPLEERTQRMREIFDQQIQKTLQVLRPPVKFAVARDFVKQKFISASDHEDLVNLHGDGIGMDGEPSQSSSKSHNSSPVPVLLNKSDDTHMANSTDDPLNSFAGGGKPAPSY
ncbi:hypothetical protein PS15p_209767 [Mucor circinelloides]